MQSFVDSSRDSLTLIQTLTERNTFAHPFSRRRAPILASSKLRNRRSAEHGVRGFLSNVVISPSLAATICNGAISTTYLAYVIELNEKHKYVSSREPPKDGTSSDIAPLDTVAGKEMRSHIEKLRLKAVEKSREYFINVISEVRKGERERETGAHVAHRRHKASAVSLTHLPPKKFPNFFRSSPRSLLSYVGPRRTCA